MSNLTIAMLFTKNNGEPATGLTLSDIDLYLTRQNRSTGAVTVVWDGSQHPTVEVSNTGAYIRIYADADLVTYNYYARGDYGGAEALDIDYVVGAIGGDTDVLQNTVPGTYESGTAGHALGRITSARITVTNPVATDGDVTVYQGDDYAAADGRALDWTDSGDTWPDLTGASITLTVHVGLLSKAGSVVTPSGTGKKVRVELTAANTGGLPIGTYPFDVQATLSNAHIVTLVTGDFTIERDYT